jgi:two-component system, OmpR family, phosphate regulon sensor histidine kinase PhoR
MSLFGPRTRSRNVAPASERNGIPLVEAAAVARSTGMHAADMTIQERTALMDICGAAVLIVDMRGVILDVNATARELFHVSGPGLMGKSLLEATLSGEVERLWEGCTRGETVRNVEVESLSGNANLVVSMEIVHASSTVPAPAAGRSPDRVVVVIRDVSDLRRLETMRRDFVANVSHELRTPLASIRAMAETLQDGALEDPSVARRFLGTIVTETERLSRIAADLLILSDAESQRPNRELFNLSPLLNDVVTRSISQAERASIHLAAAVESDLIVYANPDQMEQVVVNLVDNALKYTHSGGSVRVEASGRGDEAVVQVRDTGIGILSTDLPRIFERFYRVDKARSRQSGGTGLGLSIVKHIVEAHSGRVSVESEYNHGSVFTFTLPLYEDNNERE